MAVHPASHPTNTPILHKNQLMTELKVNGTNTNVFLLHIESKFAFDIAKYELNVHQ